MKFTTKQAAIASAVLIAISFLLGVLAWNSLPTSMATHWNAAGEVNGVSSKFFGVLFAPILSALLALVLFALPKIDPLAEGFKESRQEYDGLIVVLIAFMTLIQGAVLASNLGARFNLIGVIGPCVGALFYYIGAIMPRMKRNWFAGIRTPWTLSSDYVWQETHRLGGKLFRLAGLLALVSVLFPKQAIWFIILPILISAILATVYSYVIYRKQPHV